ncbi:hypothetical protein [Roseibium marinum]|uniref:Uncharacterized protein n=1 Tax=Roseibium marinum TaxID=281252 RepID=A0A2S3UJZ7_9HYPH|nr:hypothetical protein [Roseibium marinum]POF28044.1 hypothetical protein CLV41_11848 [Roseibium marinum]
MDSITVRENGQDITFSFNDLMKFHGPGFPGGVVHALKAMQAAFPLLDSAAPERREVTLLTAFSGPGGRDAIEMVTRAVSGDRFTVDRSLGGADIISEPPGPYLWRFGYRDRRVEAVIRPGLVREEFVLLGKKQDRSLEEETRLTELKYEMAHRLLPLAGSEVYETEILSAK